MKRRAIATLRRVEEILLLSDPKGDRAKHIHAPEDPMILEWCKRIGFGAVMDSAARQWRTHGQHGELGAHTTGAAVATLRNVLKEVRETIEYLQKQPAPSRRRK